MDVISVTALNRYVKTLLERDAVLTDVALRGEISNFVHHFKTGHFYFSLKDTQCSVKAVMFRSDAQRVPFKPENGMRVIVRCRISLFERDGAFQVYVEDLFPDGVGAMQLAFEQLKARLDAEGLFAQEHKRPLPEVPRCVGLVTSKTGAAIQDIFNVAQRRWPMARFLLCPVTVQGMEAAPGIAAAIRGLSADGRADVIIVARGGGSREDLWVFNSEEIARAAYDSAVPVVSAVGHEIDFSILDFAADLRAPTPSAAAELVLPDVRAVKAQLFTICTDVRKEIQKKLDLCYNAIETCQNAPALCAVRALPALAQERLRQQETALQTEIEALLRQKTRQLAHSAALAESLSPFAVLARGYSIVKKENTVLKNAAQVEAGETVQVQLAQGALECTVQRVQKENGYGSKKTDL